MRALKKARKLIEEKPDSPAANTFASLVIALESEQPFQLAELYKLDYNEFALALELMADWRLDRYYASKVRLLGASVQHGEQDEEAKKAAA